MAPVPNRYGSAEALTRPMPCNRARLPGASAIRGEGYPTLKAPELAGPASRLPPQRPVRCVPKLNLNINLQNAVLREKLEQVTSQPDSPGTPHWGVASAPDYKWCDTPVTDVEDDIGDAASDHDNDSVISFDGGSGLGSPTLKDVIDNFLKPHCETSDAAEVTEEHGVECARSRIPKPTPAPEKNSNVEEIEAPPGALMQLTAPLPSSLGENESLSTDAPPSLADSPSSSDGSQGSSEQSPVQRAVAKIAESRFGAAIAEELSRCKVPSPVPVATSNSHLQPKTEDCTALSAEAFSHQVLSQVNFPPRVDVPTKSVAAEKSLSSAVSIHLQNMVNSIKEAPQLSVADLGCPHSRSVSPGMQLPRTGDSSATSCTGESKYKGEQRCSELLTRLDQVLDQVDSASSTWLTGRPTLQQRFSRSISALPLQSSNPSSHLRCPQGHMLVPTAFRRGWICDGCERCFAEVVDGECCHRCALCDFDLCEPCATSAASSRPAPSSASQESLNIQTSEVLHQNPLDLHDRVAMPLMKRTETLGRAYKCLEEVNSLSISIHGVPLPAAIYNQACCLALGAEALINGTDGQILEPPLPPHVVDGAPSRDIVELRLDLAVEMLRKAVQAGYADITNMLTDPDLKLMRDTRSAEFASAVNWVRQVSGK